MNKEFIPYEQALALKELGFDEPCFRFYSEKYAIDSKTGGDIKTGEFYLTDRPKTKTMRCSAPLYQQAFRFFREKYKLCGTPQYFTGGFYCYTINNMQDQKESNRLFTEFKTYEEAELACIIKLIEIVKLGNNG